MKIVLINPPHTAIGSRVPDDHLPPLGLLAIGGPLIDAGHTVRLVDAEFGPLPLERVVAEALQEAGIIKGFAAVLSRRAVGLMVEVFIEVRLVSHSDGSPEAFIAAVQRMDEVSSCWTMTGDHDFLLHVRVPSVDELNAFVLHRLMRLDGVRDVHTQLVLQNIKGPGHVPLAHLRR